MNSSSTILYIIYRLGARDIKGRSHASLGFYKEYFPVENECDCKRIRFANIVIAMTLFIVAKSAFCCRGSLALLVRGCSAFPRDASCRLMRGPPRTVSFSSIGATSAREVRAACRSGEFRGPTSGMAPGHVQANLVILRERDAGDFREFCQANAAPCPLLEMTAPGVAEAVFLAPGSDVRTDLPLYHVWKDGVMAEERHDVTALWEDDMRAFLLGCSFTWEDILSDRGCMPRHIKEGRNVPMYDTSIPLKRFGAFGGRMVVSMRPYPPSVVQKVTEITRAFPAAHGGPVHVGDPEEIGIADIDSPSYGDAVTIHEDEIPVFWACGVTPQNALARAHLPLAITHAPGHMFVADASVDQISKWNVPGTWRARPCGPPS